MQGYTRGLVIDTDATLSADSDLVAPSQKAVKSYVDNSLSQTTITINVSDEAILDFSGRTQRSFYIPAVDQDTDILLTNDTNALVFNAFLLVTGTRGVIFPSDFFCGDESEWNDLTKTLTLVGVVDTVFEISCTKITTTGNWYLKFKEYV
jgi:hypothetical protein